MVSKEDMAIDFIEAVIAEVESVPVIPPANGWSNKKKDIYIEGQVTMRQRIVNKFRLEIEQTKKDE